MISRRELLRAGSCLTLGGIFGLGARRASAAPDSQTRSRVVLVRRPDVLDEAGNPKPPAVQGMLDEAVAALMEEKDPLEAWRRIVAPSDVVGIKSNAWERLPTPKAVEDAIRSRVLQVGVPPDSVAVDDRGVLTHPTFRRATALINTRPMRTHHWAGLGTCLKNYIMFVPKPSDYHENGCANLGAIWQLPIVRGKTRLNVLVMFAPLFHSVGPHDFSKAHTWRYGGMVVGRDPVAVDTIGARIIATRRKEFFGEERPIAPPPHHIGFADTRFGLGVSRFEAIDLVQLGQTQGA